MTIFIIDDNDIDRWIATTLCKQMEEQIELYLFEYAEPALDKLREGATADYILLDIQMPFSTGFDFLKEFERLQLKPIPIFIVSNSLNYNDREQSAQHHLVKGFIEKPLTKEKIQMILNT